MSRHRSIQVVIHKACGPDTVFDLLDADSLPGEDQAEIDLISLGADAAACRDDDRLIMERIVEIGLAVYDGAHAILILDQVVAHKLAGQPWKIMSVGHRRQAHQF